MQPRVKQKNNLPHTLSEAGIFIPAFFITFYFLSDPRFLHIPYQSSEASKDCREGFKIVFGDNISFRSWIEEIQARQISPVSKRLLLQSIPAISDAYREIHITRNSGDSFPTRKAVFSELPYREKQERRDRRTPPRAFLSRIRQA